MSRILSRIPHLRDGEGGNSAHGFLHCLCLHVKMFKLALKLVHDASNLEGREEHEEARGYGKERRYGRREGEGDMEGGRERGTKGVVWGTRYFSDTQPITKKCIPSQGSWT